MHNCFKCLAASIYASGMCIACYNEAAKKLREKPGLKLWCPFCGHESLTGMMCGTCVDATIQTEEETRIKTE